MQRADALLVNLGTFDAERRKAALAAVAVANKRRIPWVLDPVFIDRSAPRARFASRLAARKPRAVRLNPAEFGALANAKPDDAALARYARVRRTVVGLTGERDLVRDADGCHHRQRPSADGARHRHGLRGLGARPRPASRSRPIPGGPRPRR